MDMWMREELVGLGAPSRSTLGVGRWYVTLAVGLWSPFPPSFSTVLCCCCCVGYFCPSTFLLSIYHGPHDYCNELQTYF